MVFSVPEVAALRRRTFFRRCLLLASLLGVMGVTAGAARGSEPQAEFNVGAPQPPKESVIQVIFGLPLAMPTERGTLVLEAFFDRNGNGLQEAGEEDLPGELTCSVDGIDYGLPAFIPGLKRNGNFEIRCRGERFAPTGTSRDVFIERRGQIVRVDLPCLPVDVAPPTPEKPKK
ncbi:hypothetical protein DSOUD_0639 [Desulfuromonas soudanensis]|uniref:Uncharacterized protein n=1 Tax=Desulfuromonas soudanensis TaxID=1603606 RepID=A0A0M4CYI2_9BACT|nr:hypothetical protein [Desulfuromonas soudanensis]ALC15427.1 hypothetical protein DSOUD_0639 [Desulfuromonas soudanensis]